MMRNQQGCHLPPPPTKGAEDDDEEPARLSFASDFLLLFCSFVLCCCREPWDSPHLLCFVAELFPLFSSLSLSLFPSPLFSSLSLSLFSFMRQRRVERVETCTR